MQMVRPNTLCPIPLVVSGVAVFQFSGSAISSSLTVSLVVNVARMWATSTARRVESPSADRAVVYVDKVAVPSSGSTEVKRPTFKGADLARRYIIL